MDIIIDGSRHGAAKRYAEGLAERTGLKAMGYSQLERKYRLLMKLMYSQASKLPEERLTPEFKAILATYGKKVDYVDLEMLEPLAVALGPS